MTSTLRLGFVPLLDAAPLIIAAEMGFAEAEGLQFELHHAASWAMLRDMLDFGQVDAAQMLSVLPVARALGLGGGHQGLETPMVLSLNGQVIGLSPALAGQLRNAGHSFDFKDATTAGRMLGGRQIRIGVPFPFSMHSELLHYWIDALGLPAETLAVRTIPPPLMADAISAQEIDAFCVGEPWGSHAVEKSNAELLLPGTAIWSAAPEKVLATRTGWCEAHPDLAGRMLRALWRAGRWLSAPQNHATAAALLARQDYLNVAADLIDRALSGQILISPIGPEINVPQFIDFHAGVTNFPWRSQAGWIGSRLAARHGLDPAMAQSHARAIFRSDLYRLHLGAEGVPMPRTSDKTEGGIDHATPMPATRGSLILQHNRFFDGQKFDPDLPD